MRRGIEHETKYFLASSSQLNLVWCGSLESRFCIIPFSQQRHSGRRLFLPGKRRCQQSRPTGTIESVRTTVRDAASLGKYYNGVAVQIDHEPGVAVEDNDLDSVLSQLKEAQAEVVLLVAFCGTIPPSAP